jgi:hypothetical protein
MGEYATRDRDSDRWIHLTLSRYPMSYTRSPLSARYILYYGARDPDSEDAPQVISLYPWG